MGLDASASLLMGASLEHRQRTIEKTKYNSSTGEPYQTSEEESYHVFRGTDIEVSTNCDDWSGQDGYDMVIHCCDHEDENSFFIGIEIISTNSHRRSMSNGEYDSELWGEVPVINQEEADKVKKVLLESGYTGDPKLFILQNLSY